MPQYGSSQNLISQNLSQTVDSQGNPIISSDTGFGASPLGYAARVQALFGLPNATFELTPPDPTAVISQANQLPYWDIQDYSSAVMSGSAVYDSTTNSWGVNLNPGTAASGDYITMTTRSYLVNDSNLSLRQQALSVVSKVGTYSSTTQWNMQLTATYYDQTDTLLHSGTVATILDNTTWTSMAGTTTTGGTAISAAAHYVDLTYKLTATAAVTSSTSVTIKSCLLQTSSGAAGSQSFLVREAFTSSGTWTRPTGVDYLVAVVGVGAGGGGGRGAGLITQPSNNTAIGTAGYGGGGSRWGIVRELYVGDVSTVSVGIGAGGVGPAGTSVTKAGGSAGTSVAYANSSSGGTTTFGTYMVIPGGQGVDMGGVRPGSAGEPITSPMYGLEQLSAGNGNNNNKVVTDDRAGGTPQMGTAGYTILPYTIVPTTYGGTGGSGFVTATGGSQIFYTGVGTASSVAGISGGGGCGASGSANSSGGTNRGGGAGVASSGGGGSGVGVWIVSGTATITATAGSGGNAIANSGGGGGGSGGGIITAASTVAGTAAFTAATCTINIGKAGDGAAGAIYVFYVA